MFACSTLAGKTLAVVAADLLKSFKTENRLHNWLSLMKVVLDHKIDQFYEQQQQKNYAIVRHFEQYLCHGLFF